MLDFRPGVDMWWVVERSAADTAGVYLRTVNAMGPGARGGPPVHVHPEAEESYEVLEGEIELLLEGRWRRLRAGERVTVAPGQPHTVRTEAPARYVNVHRPALRFEQMFREMAALLADGRIRALPPKDPRSVLYAAMLFAKYPDLQRVTSPPPMVFQLLARLGRAVGLRLER